MNVFSHLKEALKEEIIGYYAQQHIENPEKITKALELFGVAIIGGLVKRITTESGINFLYNETKKIDFTPSELGDILKDPARYEHLKSVGEKNLNTVLPGLKSAMSLMVSKSISMRNSVASSLAGPMMSIVMSVLKQKITDKQMTIEDFANYLGNQRENILQVVPPLNDIIVETMGIQGVLQNFVTPKVERSASSSLGEKNLEPFLLDSHEDTTPPVNYLKWLSIAAIVALLVAGGWYFWQQQQAPRERVEEVSLNMPDSLEEARTIATDTTTKSSSTVKDSIVATPTLNPTDVKNTMEVYLSDIAAKSGRVFRFENVDFLDNTTQLKPEAIAPVKSLGDLLKKYPNAQVKLVGFANDAKPPVTNKVLSTKRVFIIKDELIKAGINYMRIDAEGRGTGVSPKDSTRKQKPLREIYVRFVKK